MKRGCTVEFVHFSESEKGTAKVGGIIRKLGEYAPDKLAIHSVPFSNVQKAIVNGCELRFTCVLCKRLMYRAAGLLAKAAKAKALVTGENLAQVASQTLDNLVANDGAVAIPKFRPLLTMDKEETIMLANKIGTYDLSIKDAHSCRFVPRKPATASRKEIIEKEESMIKNIDVIISEAIASSVKILV